MVDGVKVEKLSKSLLILQYLELLEPRSQLWTKISNIWSTGLCIKVVGAISPNFSKIGPVLSTRGRTGFARLAFLESSRFALPYPSPRRALCVVVRINPRWKPLLFSFQRLKLFAAIFLSSQEIVVFLRKNGTFIISAWIQCVLCVGSVNVQESPSQSLSVAGQLFFFTCTWPFFPFPSQLKEWAQNRNRKEFSLCR